MDADQLNTLERAYELATKARQVFGDEAQDRMLTEEAGELCAAVAQFGRGRVTREQIKEEAADVIIVALGSLGASGWIKMREKLDRLHHRLFQSTIAQPMDRYATLEAENTRLRAEIQRLSGNGPLIAPSADPRLP